MTFDVALRIRAEGQQAVDTLGRVGQAAEQAGQRARRATDDMASGSDRVAQKLDGIREMWIGIGAALGGMASVAQIVQMADAVTTLNNRLLLATGSASQAAKTYQDLFAIAQRSRTSFTELGGVYATLARAGQANLTVVEAIGNAMAIGGGSASSMQAALVQLGQGMASGVLRGEELNSVMEQTPRLAMALADGLGVPIGQLRKMGEEGQLTAQRVVEALSNSAPKLAEEMKASTATVSQGFQVLNNSLTNFVGEMDAATGTSKALSTMLQTLGGAIDSVASIIRENQTVFAIIGTALAGAGVVAGVGLLKVAIVAIIPVFASLAVAMGPVALAAAGVAAAVGAATAAWSAFKNSTGSIENQIKSLQGPASIYDGDLRDPTKREARIKELQAQLAMRSGAGLDTRAEDARFGASRKEFDSAQAAAARLVAIRRELSGVDEKYTKQVGELAQMLKAGNITQAEYNALTAQSYSQTKVGRDAAQAASAAAKKAADAESKAWNDAVEEYERYVHGRDMAAAGTIRNAQESYDAALKEISGIEAQIKAQQAANDAALNGSDAVAQLELAKIRDAAISAERLALTAMERQQNEPLAEQYRRQADALRRLAKEKEAALGIDGIRKERDASRKAIEEASKASEDLNRTLTDALMRAFESGKGFAQSFRDTVVNMFSTMVLRPIVSALVAPVQQAFGLGGGAGGQMLSSAGGNMLGSAASSLGLGSLSGLGSIFSAGASMAMNGGAGVALQGAGAMMQGGSIAQGLAQGAGVAGSYLGGAALGVYGGRAISGGRSAFGGSGNAAVNTGTIIGAIAGGPIGAAIGGAIGGLVNRAFGTGPRKVNERGFVGTLDGGGLQGGQMFESWSKSGGWFRSGKSGTDFSAIDGQIKQAMDAGGQAMLKSAQEYAKVLGLPSEYMKSVSSSVRVTLTGNAEADAKAVTEAINRYGEALTSASRLLVAQYAKAGESTIETMQRLAGLQVFSNSMNELGGVFSSVARLSFAAREELAGLAGGLDAFASKALGFVQNYYSRDEVAGLKASEIESALKAMGITQDLTSREDFRRLVDGTNVSTAEGRQQLNALLDLSASFVEVADFLQETGQTLSQAAALAPANSPLAPAFSQDQTVAAVDRVGSGIDKLVDIANRMLDQIKDKTLSPPARYLTQPAEVVVPGQSNGRSVS